MSAIPEVLKILAHEMRTPIAAIMGYQELLAEGIYGTIDERGQEPLDRIGYSARQLQNLIDGVEEISASANVLLNAELEEFEPAAVLRSCLTYALDDAKGRNVRIETNIPDELPTMFADPKRFCRAVDLTIAAAVKSSYGHSLSFDASGSENEIVISITHTGLTPERDNPEYVRHSQARLTGSGLRLAIVRQIAMQMNGGLELTPSRSGSTVCVRFGTRPEAEP